MTSQRDVTNGSCVCRTRRRLHFLFVISSILPFSLCSCFFSLILFLNFFICLFLFLSSPSPSSLYFLWDWKVPPQTNQKRCIQLAKQTQATCQLWQFPMVATLPTSVHNMSFTNVSDKIYFTNPCLYFLLYSFIGLVCFMKVWKSCLETIVIRQKNIRKKGSKITGLV